MPVNSVITVVKRNIMPGSITRSCCDSSATEMPTPWNNANNPCRNACAA